MSGTLGNKEIMAKNIRRLMDEKGVSRRELCNLLGFKYSTVTDWLNAEKYPRIDKIEMMANFFGVNKADLVEPFNEHPATNSYVHIPVLGAIPAGIPSEAIESVLDYEDIPADMAKHGSFYGLIARGHSMEPTINDGDVVIIRQQPTVESGEIAVVKLNGNEATLKEVKITDEGIFIIGHNRSAFEPMFLTHEQAKSLPLRILGKAVELRRTLGK